jgi:hypothetical protein
MAGPFRRACIGLPALTPGRYAEKGKYLKRTFME